MIQGFVANLADGDRLIDGNVENISTGGFQVTDLPKSFGGKNHTYTAVLSGGGKHYKMLAKPCWQKQQGENKIHFGFKILDASWEWVDFTLHGIPALRDEKKTRVPA